MATLDQLTAVRSQLARGVEAYLEAIVALDVPGWNFVGGRERFQQVYEWPHVVWHVAAERPATSTRGTEEDDDRGEFARTVDDAKRQTWFVDPRATEHDVQAWQPRRRILVVGRPGEGKTALTQMSARALAERALRELKARTTPLAELAIPLWARVEDVVAARSVRGGVRNTLVKIVSFAIGRPQERPESEPDPLVDAIVRHLTTALDRQNATLFLDGLDERPDRTPDGLLWSEAFRDLAPAEASSCDARRSQAGRSPACRIVMTSRSYPNARADVTSLQFVPAAIREGEPDEAGADCDLAPLSGEQQAAFVGRWFDGDPAAAARIHSLLQTLQTHATFADMATNALLLTIVCTSGSELDPKTARRVHLYDRAVRDMLRGLHRPLRLAGAMREEADLREADRLMVLADAGASLFEKRVRTFPDTVWAAALREACRRRLRVEGSRFLDDLHVDLKNGGLVVSPARGQLQFLHLTFYEYLAAVGLALDGSARVIATLTRYRTDDRWRQVALFVVGYLSLIMGDQDKASAVVTSLATQPGRLAAWMGEALVEAGEGDPRVKASAGIVTRPARDAAVTGLLATMRDDGVPATTRADAGTSLGRLGDPRFDPDCWYLPCRDADDPRKIDDLLGFVKILAGTFWMGSDKARDPEAYDDELPRHRVMLKTPFYLARWPVTVAQFQAYVRDARVTPGLHGSLVGVANYPVVHVSWREAMAYGDWLTEKVRKGPGALRRLADQFDHEFGARGWVVTLPTEAQWEWVARGDDERRYPWGNVFDANLANSRSTGIGASAVGCFRGGRAPSGVEEQCGNVWEWSYSVFRPYPYLADDGREAASFSHRPRVVRGGSFHFTRRYVRAAVRLRFTPDYRHYNLGFRVVVSPFTSDL